MLLSKKSTLILLVMASMMLFFGKASAGDKFGYYECPKVFKYDSRSYKLINAGFFDGSPDQRVEHVPEIDEATNTRKWPILKQIDPYFVCMYDGIDHTITLHAKNAKVCQTREKPFRAFCQ